MMKKLFSTVTLLMAFAFSAFAGEPDTEDHEGSFVITDCGTIHQIPSDISDEERCALLDKFTVEDCLYGGF